MNKRPNILFIMTDQQRWDSLGCYGSKVVPTPNIDKLAKEGVLFENCYVNNTVCTPSRASIFTGKHLPEHGVYRLYDVLPQDEVLFTKHLQDTGYQTALIGKLHVSGAVFEAENRNKNDGFDIYDWSHEPSILLDSKFNGYRKWLQKNHPDFYEIYKKEGRNYKNVSSEVHATKWTADRTIEIMQNREKNKPFCYVMSFFDPHNPYDDHPLEMQDLVDDNEIKAVIYKKDESHNNKPDGILREHDNSSFHELSSDDIYKMRKGYYASITFIDMQVGRVLDELDSQGIYEDTMVVFVSDHGDMLGDHELMTKGAFFYDACAKVPFIIRYPRKIQAGLRWKTPVQPHDIAATVLEQSGFSRNALDELMPDSIDLVSMINTDESTVERDFAVTYYKGTGIYRASKYYDPPIYATMIRDRRYKLNVYHDISAKCQKIEGELFDINDDPSETKNLWNDIEFIDIKMNLMGRLMNSMVKTDKYTNCSRGGESPTVTDYMNNKSGC